MIGGRWFTGLARRWLIVGVVLWAMTLAPWPTVGGYPAVGRLAAVAGARPEARGLWVVRDALATPESIDEIVALADRVGFNVLFVQVNGRAEAYYRSVLVPRASGVDPDFDPLQYVIDRARERGIAVHAWVNAFTASMLSSRPTSPEHVLNRHPDWVLYDETGRSLWDYGANVVNLELPAIMLDPGVPEVQDYVVAVVEEIAQAYDVDGIHLDYIRYPGESFGYHPVARARFQELTGVDPLWLVGSQADLLRTSWGDAVFERLQEAWKDWRRRQVTTVVRRVYEGVSQHQPWIVVSAAVIADATIARERMLQDWPAWLEEGIVDLVVPMAYAPDEGTVSAQLREAAALSGDRHVYGGLGAWRLGDRLPLLERLVVAARQAGTEGIVLFSYNSLRHDPQMATLLQERLFREAAWVPTMEWKPQRPGKTSRRGRGGSRREGRGPGRSGEGAGTP